MNRTRLTREVNEIKNKFTNLFIQSLGDWYVIKVYATSDHIADRFLDRSTSLKNDLKTFSEIVYSLANHYSCNLLYFLKEYEEIHRVVLHRKVNGKTFAVPVTVKKLPPMEEGGKAAIVITLRTVIPEYTERMPTKNILIDYKYPKITFEYDGFRRVLSRLCRLVQSPECPDALKVLRVK